MLTYSVRKVVYVENTITCASELKQVVTEVHLIKDNGFFLGLFVAQENNRLQRIATVTIESVGFSLSDYTDYDSLMAHFHENLDLYWSVINANIH